MQKEISSASVAPLFELLNWLRAQGGPVAGATLHITCGTTLDYFILCEGGESLHPRKKDTPASFAAAERARWERLLTSNSTNQND